MTKFVALVALGQEILRCISCGFVAELVDEEAVSNAVVGAHLVMGEHNNRVMIPPSALVLSFSPERYDFNNLYALRFIVLFPFFDYIIVVLVQIDCAFCDTMDDDAILRLVSFEALICIVPIDLLQFT